MTLTDGFIIYPKLSVADFIIESGTWETGLCSVICDSAIQAVTDLSLSLIEYNSILLRSLNVYNYDLDTMKYLRHEPERFPFNFDKIHREQWRRRAVFNGQTPYPIENGESELNIPHLKIKHISDSSYGVGFLTLPESIIKVDKYASEIAYNYTYGSFFKGTRDYKNREMRKVSNIYYIYDQKENFFFKMN